MNKLTEWEKSESEENSENSAQDQAHPVTENKAPRPDLYRYLAPRKAVLEMQATVFLH